MMMHRIKKYERMVNGLASRACRVLRSYDYEDVQQELILELVKCAGKIDAARVEAKLVTAILKNRIREMIAAERKVERLSELVAIESHESPIVDAVMLEELHNFVQRSGGRDEYAILGELLKGRRHRETARVLGLAVMTYYRRLENLQRIIVQFTKKWYTLGSLGVHYT